MKIKRLRVLMYHSVTTDGKKNAISIPVRDLEAQFKYISQKNYNAISLQQLTAYMEQGRPLPAKPILITFDDGYRDNFLSLYPLLVRHALKASVFLVPGFIGPQADGTQSYLSLEEIRQMDPAVIEFGLHTFNHQSYAELSLAAIEQDIKRSLDWFKASGLTAAPALAYTYGAYPKKDKIKREAMFDIFRRHGLKLAFRIGNRINKLPLKNPFLAQRIDIRGADSFFRFKRKLKWGGRIIL